MKIDNSLWCEAYRPQTLDNYVGNEHIKAKMLNDEGIEIVDGKIIDLENKLYRF